MIGVTDAVFERSMAYLSERTGYLQNDIAKGRKSSHEITSSEQRSQLSHLLDSEIDSEFIDRKVKHLQPLIDSAQSTLSSILDSLQSAKVSILAQTPETIAGLNIANFAQSLSDILTSRFSEKFGGQYLFAGQDYLSSPALAFSDGGLEHALEYFSQDKEAFFSISGYSQSPDQFRRETISEFLEFLDENSMSETQWSEIWVGTHANVARVAKIDDLDVRLPNIGDFSGLRGLMQTLMVATQFDFSHAPQPVRKAILDRMLDQVSVMETHVQECLRKVGVLSGKVSELDEDAVKDKIGIGVAKDAITKVDLYAATVEMEACQTTIELSYRIISQNKSLFLFKYL